MQAELIKKLEEVLTAGCDAHIASGGTIIGSGCPENDGELDPISASIDLEEAMKQKTDYLSQLHYGLVKKMGLKIMVIEMVGFINAFDGLKHTGEDRMAYDLGKQFREKYIKENKDG